ncbi:hypothetical protein D3C86_1501460 [compost metagenome]
MARLGVAGLALRGLAREVELLDDAFLVGVDDGDLEAAGAGVDDAAAREGHAVRTGGHRDGLLVVESLHGRRSPLALLVGGGAGARAADQDEREGARKTEREKDVVARLHADSTFRMGGRDATCAATQRKQK